MAKLPGALRFAQTEFGFRLKIEGRGTMALSRTAGAFVAGALAHEHCQLVVDLSDADYLDSTFLGALLGMHREFGRERFRVAASAEKVADLFGPTRLDVLLGVTDRLPPETGPYVTLPPQAINGREMARHIMECHRRLAEAPGPQQAAFAAIAGQMERELQAVDKA